MSLGNESLICMFQELIMREELLYLLQKTFFLTLLSLVTDDEI